MERLLEAHQPQTLRAVEVWIFAVQEKSLWHGLIQLKQLCLDRITRCKWLIMREFSWMNISRVIADLLDNTGSLNGFALSFIWGAESSVPGDSAPGPALRGCPVHIPRQKGLIFPRIRLSLLGCPHRKGSYPGSTKYLAEKGLGTSGHVFSLP